MKKPSVIEELRRSQESDSKRSCLDAGKMKDIARGCGVPQSRVYGVATFYTMLSARPRGKHVIRICRNLACCMDGSDGVVSALKAELGVEPGGTSSDGEFTLEESSCLGLCSSSPAMMIDDKPYGKLTAAGVGEILWRVRKGG